VGPLDRFGKRWAADQRVVPAGKGEGLVDRGVPQPGDDGQLLTEPVETLGDGWERNSIGLVFAAVPTGPDT
jgi:hypothetical protein